MFNHSDLIHLKAAEGWLELESPLEANEELDNIRAELRARPEVLSLRYNVYLKLEQWDGAYEIASALVKLLPDQPDPWIGLAYAMRRKSEGSIEQAEGILLEAHQKFPKEYLFPFNLACYCSQQNRFEEAQAWLKKAMALDEMVVKKLAMEDEDLKPLWDNMSGTMWKRE